MNDISNEELVYLRPNVVPETLIDQWYANAHLMSPITAALNIKKRHLKIMKSFIEDPKLHAFAVKKPEMRGGPFIDFSEERVHEIEKLYNDTIEKRGELLALADAVDELHQVLTQHADGSSIQALYDKIPALLRGYVELIYDLNNNPTFRIYEALLYKTYYDNSAESIALQMISKDDSRSFVLSTPRLEEDSIIRLEIPFNSPVIDDLFKMLRKPASFHSIKTALGIRQKQEMLFRDFFTTEAPEPYNSYIGTGIRTRYFGHASICIETKDVTILADPVISYGYPTDLYRYTFSDLPETIDFIMITHNHQDHVNIETLIQLRHRVRTVIIPRCCLGNLQDPSLKIMLNKIGFENVIELSEGEDFKTGNCVITGLPFFGEHSDLDIRSKLCYHVRLQNNLTILLAADSCNIEPKAYELMRDITGGVDVMFLGMECDGAPLSWVYGPLMPQELDREKDQSRRLAGCDYEQAISMVNCFNPSDVFVYAMGMEPWLEYISSIKYTSESRPIQESNKLIRMCLKMGINAERLYGEKTIEYDTANRTTIII